MILSPDPSFAELQIFWEKQYWYKSKVNWHWAVKAYESYLLFFGPDRKPRDVFRQDVAEYKVWCTKKGISPSRLKRQIEYGARLYRLLDEIEVVEKNFNPFTGMAPRVIKD